MNKSLLPYALYASKKIGVFNDIPLEPDGPMKIHACEFRELAKAVFDHPNFLGIDNMNHIGKDARALEYMIPLSAYHAIDNPRAFCRGSPVISGDLTTFLLKALPVLDGVTIGD